jgi:hypothetical protein
VTFLACCCICVVVAGLFLAASLPYDKADDLEEQAEALARKRGQQ